MLTLGKKVLSVPILQGGMGVGVSLGGLAGAVAACGGMGCISTADAGYREPDFARDPASANHRALTAEIRKAKQIANGAGMVAINAMVATQDYAAAIRTASSGCTPYSTRLRKPSSMVMPDPIITSSALRLKHLSK